MFPLCVCVSVNQFWIEKVSTKKKFFSQFAKHKSLLFEGFISFTGKQKNPNVYK